MILLFVGRCMSEAISFNVPAYVAGGAMLNGCCGVFFVK